MKLYRDAHGVIVGTQAEAKRMGKGWEPVDVPVDKQGLIDYLNKLKHSEPVDDEIGSAGELSAIRDDQFTELNKGVPTTSYTHQSVETDEQFAALPLARQLHFAGMALEAAREQL